MDNRRIIAEGWDTGLVGTLGLRLVSSDGLELLARTTSGISESPTGSGRYVKTVSVNPANYPIECIWDDEETFASSLLENLVNKSTIREAVGGLWTDEQGNDFELTISDIVPTIGPILTNVRVDTITQTSAIIRWNLSQAGTAQVRYGTTPNLGLVTTYDPVLQTSKAVSVSGLSDDTLYYYQVVSRNSDGIQTVSQIQSFSTLAVPIDITGPVISNVRVDTITQTSATIRWDVSELATGQVEYGDTMSLGTFDTLDIRLLASHSHTITGLASNTSIYFTPRSRDAAGNLTVGDVATFDTLADNNDTTPPTISNITVDTITETTATVRWTLNEPGTARVRFGLTNALNQSTLLNPALGTSHSHLVSGLPADSQIYFAPVSKDAANNEATGPTDTFNTLPASTEGRTLIGGWRLQSVFSRGSIAINFANRTLWMAGHASENVIEQFQLPDPGTGTDPNNWPQVAVSQIIPRFWGEAYACGLCYWQNKLWASPRVFYAQGAEQILTLYAADGEQIPFPDLAMQRFAGFVKTGPNQEPYIGAGGYESGQFSCFGPTLARMDGTVLINREWDGSWEGREVREPNYWPEGHIDSWIALEPRNGVGKWGCDTIMGGGLLLPEGFVYWPTMGLGELAYWTQTETFSHNVMTYKYVYDRTTYQLNSYEQRPGLAPIRGQELDSNGDVYLLKGRAWNYGPYWESPILTIWR